MSLAAAAGIRPRYWAVLLILAFLWGSSYLMVKLALRAWSPDQITGLRVVMAAVILVFTIMSGRHRLPRDLRSWGYFLAIALVGNCIPFFLISWGQQRVESGLAGIMAAVTPLCVLLLAHYTLEDERLSVRHLVAFVLGFCGILVLMGPDSLAALGGSGSRLVAQLAVLAGAVCYAVATVMARLMPAHHPVVTATAVMLLASAMVGPVTVPGALLESPYGAEQLFAIGFLGVLGTGVASILYFYLVRHTGARFVSLLNYLVPLWAVALGALVAGEVLPLNAMAALVLILGALVMTQRGGI